MILISSVAGVDSFKELFYLVETFCVMKKKYLLLFIAIITIGFASCKKDKVVDKPALVSNDISGNWKLSSAIDEYIFGVKSVLSVNHPLRADTIDHINLKRTVRE